MDATPLCSTELPIQAIQLEQPPLTIIAQCLSTALKRNYAQVDVSVVPCPDLSLPPFSLAAPGLCGLKKSAVLDIGSTRYLFPLPDLTRQYDFKGILDVLPIGTTRKLVLGACAAPFWLTRRNMELVSNVFVDDGQLKDESRVVMLSGETHLVKRLNDYSSGANTTGCAILGNVFVCQGSCEGEVLRVRVKTRLVGGAPAFDAAISRALGDEFGEKVVALGGCFHIKRGKCRFHLVGEFSSVPLKTREDVLGWLHFYDVEAPVVCQSVIVSHDPGLELRLYHSHGYGVNGGGHYEEDVDAEQIEYEGYFQVAGSLYRVNRSQDTCGTV